MKFHVLKFYSNTCPPCKLLAPIMEKVKKDYDKAQFFNIDVDEYPEKAMSMSVMSIPTVIILKDNEEIIRFTGMQPESQVRKIFNKYLK